MTQTKMTRKMKNWTKRIRKAVNFTVSVSFCAFLLISLMFTQSCGSKSGALVNTNSKTKAEKTVDEFNDEIKALKTADFDYIFVFQRKDGKPMEQEDKQFVKNNSHYGTNRFTLTKDEKVIFAGSNYKFSDEGLAALKERFDFEDFSKSAAVIEKTRTKRELQRMK